MKHAILPQLVTDMDALKSPLMNFELVMIFFFHPFICFIDVMFNKVKNYHNLIHGMKLRENVINNKFGSYENNKSSIWLQYHH